MDNKRNNQKLKELIRKMPWKIFGTIIVLLISQTFTAFSGWTIVDPFLQKTMPPEIKIDPYPHPQIHDGKQ